MPTITGLRRRGYTPEAMRDFCERIGVAKNNSTVDVGLLEYCIREDLNTKAPRTMAILRPLKIVLDNYPVGQSEELEAENNSENPSMGNRIVSFSREIYIEQDDFMENPPKKFFRLAPGQMVRLKSAYIIKCEEVIKDDAGAVVELRCTYDVETKSGSGVNAGRKVKGVLHWVAAVDAIDAEIRLYDYLLKEDIEESEGDFMADFNPDSKIALTCCKLEPSLAKSGPEKRYQFLRQGYFCLDAKASSEGKPVFHRIVSLKDSWGKQQSK